MHLANRVTEKYARARSQTSCREGSQRVVSGSCEFISFYMIIRQDN